MGNGSVSIINFDITKSAAVFISISIFHAGVLLASFEFSKKMIKAIKNQMKWIKPYLLGYTFISAVGIVYSIIDAFRNCRSLNIEYLFTFTSITSIFFINLVVYKVPKVLINRPGVEDTKPVANVGSGPAGGGSTGSGAAGGGPGGAGGGGPVGGSSSQSSG